MGEQGERKGGGGGEERRTEVEKQEGEREVGEWNRNSPMTESDQRVVQQSDTISRSLGKFLMAARMS